MKNADIESFSCSLLNECLNRELFYTLTEVRVVIENLLWKCNKIRSHRSFGLLTPLEFAAQETDPEISGINHQGMRSTWAKPSLRPNLDTVYNLTLNHTTKPLRLTYKAAQVA